MEDLFKKTNVMMENAAFKSDNQRTVIVEYHDGYKKEYLCIDNPYAYIKECMSNPNVKRAFIKPKGQDIKSIWNL